MRHSARHRSVFRSRWVAAGVALLVLGAAVGCGDRDGGGSDQPGTSASGAVAAEQRATEQRAASEGRSTSADTLIAARNARPAPDFTRPALGSDSLRLSDYRGQVVVLNFWATWCAPCRIETPEFVALQEEMGGEGLQFVGVSLDEGGPGPVRAFADEMGVNYPIVLAGRPLAQRYGGIPALPTTFVIDKQGRIRKQIVGLTSRGRLLPLVRLLLAEQPASGRQAAGSNAVSPSE